MRFIVPRGAREQKRRIPTLGERLLQIESPKASFTVP